MSLSTRILVCLLAAAGWGAAPAAAQDAATRARMAELVQTLRVLLPLSSDDATFSAPENRAVVAAALADLARSGEALRAHGNPSDAGFTFLSRSLARDTRAIRDRYAREEWAQSRFLLHEVTENCVACHSRRPDPLARPLGRRLVDEAVLAGMTAPERVRLEVATRQFDRALVSYEALFAGDELSATDLDLLGFVDGYLEVCLRVRVGSCDPVPALKRLRSRPEVLPALARNVDAWIASSRELAARPPLAPELPTVRELVDEANDRERFPDARSALVPYFTASRLLHQIVIGGDASLEDLGETYYWLGTIESRVGRTTWPSEGEYYLEAAIRVAPAAETARRAYSLLEETIEVGYSGSAGLAVPDDERQRLVELRQLIYAARQGVPAPQPQ